MGLFENFPYTNFHNLNLDWIIKILKNAVAELEEIQANWESVRDTANTAKTTADAAAVKAENAKTAANGAMTKADSAETTAKNADANAELSLVQSTQAQDAATAAEAAANEAKETAARAESTASAAKTTAGGVDGKASAALTNSQEAVTTANSASDKAITADSKVDALTTTVNSIGETAENALSLAQTNEGDISSIDADIAQLNTILLDIPNYYNCNNLTLDVGTISQNSKNYFVYTFDYNSEAVYDPNMSDWIARAQALTDFNIVLDCRGYIRGTNSAGKTIKIPVVNTPFIVFDDNFSSFTAALFYETPSYGTWDGTIYLVPQLRLSYRGTKRNS